MCASVHYQLFLRLNRQETAQLLRLQSRSNRNPWLPALLLSCGQVVIYADYPRLTALKRTTMVIAARSDMLAPANVASVRSLRMMKQTINVEQTKITMLTQLTSYMRLA